MIKFTLQGYVLLFIEVKKYINKFCNVFLPMILIPVDNHREGGQCFHPFKQTSEFRIAFTNEQSRIYIII